MKSDDERKNIDLETGASGKAHSGKPEGMTGGILAALVLFILFLSIPAALVHDFAGVLVLGGGLGILIWKRRENPADVIGLILITYSAAPFLRRLHDFRLGWNPFSVLLLTPYLCFIPLVAEVVRSLPLLRRPTLIPILFVLAGLIWAFIVGLWNFGQTSAIIGAVEWFSGPLFFCYMALSGRKLDYQRLGNWVTPLMVVEAIYGLYQWAAPPLWDAQWLLDSGMTSSMGAPFPFMMRTFGTLNSTGIYSFICTYYLVAGIGWKRYVPVSILVIAALATTMVRAAWIISILGVFLAVVLQGGSNRYKSILRIGIIGAVLVIAGSPLLARFDSLADRFGTLGNLKGDTSYNDRKALMNASINTLLNLPEGAGLGSVGRGAKLTNNGIAGMDNGFIALVYMLGWAGAFCYLGGFMLVALWSIFKGDLSRPEIGAMGGLVLVLFASNAFGLSFSDIGGIISWSSLGVAYLASVGSSEPAAPSRLETSNAECPHAA